MKRLLVLLAVLYNLSASAQMFDTTEYRQDLSFFYNSFETENLTFQRHSEDTSLQFGHTLTQTDINAPLFLNTGRTGSPEMSLELGIPQYNGFQLATNVFRNWFLIADSVRYYNSPTPRTDLTYTQATGDLLYLKAEHSQNIAKNWNFGLNYVRNKTNNLYYTNLPLYNQERITNIFATQFYSHYFTMNRKYEVFTSFTNNKSTTRESFGISNTTQFDTLAGRGKTYSGIANFTNATNTYKERMFSVTQFYRPGNRTIKLTDSTSIYDSTTASIKAQWFHEFTAKRTINQFTDDDPNLDLYPIRLISLVTNDSIYVSTIANRFGYVNGDSSHSTKFWLLHEGIRIRQHFFHSSNYQHVRVGFEGKKQLNTAALQLQSHYSATGYNRDDYGIHVLLKNPFANSTILASVSQVRRTPDYNDQFFGSNYLYWNQPLNAAVYTNGNITYSLKKHGLTVQATGRNTSNMVYYDTSGIPQQLSNNVQYLNANVRWNLTFLGSYHWESRTTFQHVSSDKIPLPQTLTRNRLYKEGYLFSKNMWARFGLEISYFSEFSGLTYNPVVRQFTLATEEVGGYPIVDVFFNASVKTMELYVCSNHITQGNFVNDSYSAAFYPLIQRTFQFGVNWRLFD